MRSAILVCLVTCACGGDRRPDVLLVTIDTLRADHVGSYGYALDTTPEIDRLARESLVFDVAYAPMGTTCPSHATLLTGRHPLAHGVVRNGLELPPGEETLPELLADAGWRTAAFVSSFPVSRRFGVAQGFDHFDDAFPSEGGTSPRTEWAGEDVPGGFDRSAGDTVDAVESWLEHGPTDAPLFLWVHLFDPHEPYAPPAGFAERFEADHPDQPRHARYDGEIRYTDGEVGRLVERVEAARPDRELLFVLTADHGQGLGDHGIATHDRSTYEMEVRVPLLVRWPGRVAPARSDLPAHLVDVPPTLAGLLGLDLRESWRGIDLLDASGEEERPLHLLRPYFPGGRPKLSEVGFGFGVRRGRWKYFEASAEGRRELYDLERDPDERRNLVLERPGVAEELARIVAEHRAREMPAGATYEGGVRDRAGLEALGYVDE